MRNTKLEYEGAQKNATYKRLLLLLNKTKGRSTALPTTIHFDEPRILDDCDYVLTNENGQHITKLTLAKGHNDYYLGDITTRPVIGMKNSRRRSLLVHYTNKEGAAKLAIWIHPRMAKNPRIWANTIVRND